MTKYTDEWKCDFSLTCYFSGAPRLLQAIARDNVVPFLDVFKVTTSKGEPIRALIITAVIAEIGIIIAVLEMVAPLIDVWVDLCEERELPSTCFEAWSSQVLCQGLELLLGTSHYLWPGGGGGKSGGATKFFWWIESGLGQKIEKARVGVEI